MSARILIIDDETNIRTMIRLTLEHVGYSVDTAADGDEGLRKFGDGSDWDLVLVDQRMPGLSGQEVQREVHRRNPDTRLIMITAFGTIDLALEAIQSGASDFLRKPFTADTLRQAVKSALEKPVQRMTAVPIGLVCKEFTRTTINGFSFDIDRELVEHDESRSRESGETFKFAVRHGDDRPSQVKVVLPSYVMELAKAYIDSDQVPGDDRFWQAMCEEALANYLWQNAEVPASGVLRIEDLTTSLQRWLDAVLTVELSADNARK